MGITIVQKSDLSKPRPEAKKALVLAGGAISGGAFKLGGLAALNRFFVNCKVTEFDIYMGISAGAFLAAPIAAGIEPSELVEAVIGEPGKISRFRMSDFYYPNFREMWERPAGAIRDLATLGPKLTWKLLKAMPGLAPDLVQRARDFAAAPSAESAEHLVEPIIQILVENAPRQSAWLPSGLFDNSRIESYIRHNLERNGLPNNFRQLKLMRGKSLYIGATNLNTAQSVVFGHDEDNSVTISEAVMASTAIPAFFKPARLGPVGREQDYVDAAVRKTANLSVAVRHGANLVVCYNPFRPFVNYRHRVNTNDRSSIADFGMAVIINQAFRALLHSRLRLGVEKLKLDETFHGDLLLIEPTETDARFFAMNPLAFWNRGAAAEHGFQSVKQSLTKHYDSLKAILGAYGIEVDLDAIGDRLRVERTGAEAVALRQAEIDGKRPKLRLVSGGR
ncbi:MAG: patatin-like phospholipase family protein [Myxococcota bacterium]